MGTLVFSIFGSILLFLVLGAPIGFAILIGTFVSMLLLHLPGSMMMLRMASGTQSFVLTAIPFFTLAGVLMREGGITRRITDCCLLLVGHLKGSLGHVNVVASMIFGGISGSSVADTASIGNVLIPEMVDKKYPANFSAAITAVSSTIGVIIPPSIPMILYSIAGEVSIGRLFLAGAIPGLMVGILQMCINSFMSNKHDFPKAREKMPRFGEIIKGFRHGIFAIGMPVLIVGGIVAGIVTATEAAVLAVVYALVLGLFVYKELDLSKFPSMLKETAMTTAIVMLIVVSAQGLGWVLSYARIPQAVSETLLTLSSSPIIVLLIINFILLIVGMVSDIAPNILILTPIFLPVVTSLGIDPVHFGVIVVLNQAIALVTPPVGNCLYICSNLGKVSVEQVFLAGMPFLLSNVGVLLLVTIVPEVCMWLPNMLMQ